MKGDKMKLNKICWLFTIIGVLIGTYVFVVTLTKSNGAPQEAAGAAIALCFVVIPYVLARAVEKLEFKSTEFSFNKTFLIF
jgi:magnesium-transporting ATPase (P-type)